MSSLVSNYFRYGSDILGVKELQYSNFPYTVQPNPEKSMTAKDAESLLKAVQSESLKDRVQSLNSGYNVDQFFRVIAPQNAPKVQAIKLWGTLRSRCQLIGIGAGLSALSLSILALRHPPIYITLALFVATVVLCVFAGWSYQRYQVADHQLSVWRNPGEDFALRRKAALELPLSEISKKKCFIGNPQGTLHAVEILSLFKLYFKEFATPLLEKKCDQLQEKSRWVSNFFTSNPLLIDFFKDNPSLHQEKGWTEILYVQQSLRHLQTFFYWNEKILPKQEQEAATLKKNMQDSFQSLMKKVAKDLKLDPSQATEYQKRIFQALDQELFSKISTLIQLHKKQAAALNAQVYPDLRDLLEKFNKNMFQQRIFALDFYKFRNLPDFEKEFKKLRNLIPKVIEKAKSFSHDDSVYQKFVAEVFKP